MSNGDFIFLFNFQQVTVARRLCFTMKHRIHRVGMPLELCRLANQNVLRPIRPAFILGKKLLLFNLLNRFGFIE